MSEPCPRTSYADNAWQGTCRVEENVRVARDTYRLRLACPEIAQRILPGQFLMLRLTAGNDPLLGRPLALYDVYSHCDSSPDAVQVVYLVVGKMTTLLAEIKPGATIDAWGPLGNGFEARPTEHLVMVAGGIGQTPFPAVARECLGLHCYGEPRRQVPRAKKVTLCYGVRSSEYLAGVDDFERLGVEVHVSTDDGSAGHHGLVTDVARSVIERSDAACRMVCCGPEPMLAATAELARELNVPCEVSLERAMACGIGACFSCVAKVRDPSGNWTYRRTCIEGPVFDAAGVEF
ncbi:MAG: dihydroorotate dehydrogenase electron transfer subunit [Candidatus Nealsonbacteria bacterium]|nr:dihydroorotate dehydrogenase electron transfer subunit [Candidatus Nealsonbacteria bacterium]